MANFIGFRNIVISFFTLFFVFAAYSCVLSFPIEQDIRIGNRVVLNKVLPPCSNNLLRQEKIMIECEVLPNGKIGEMKPLSEGNPALIASSMRSLKKWTFDPVQESLIMKGNITFTFNPDQSTEYEMSYSGESSTTIEENYSKADSEELKLYSLIMQYRRQLDLPDIPLSKSLTYVANLHVHDLMQHGPDVGDCNSHSWSNKGNWSACCYTSDHAEAKCMWSKPRELTRYQGNGYEIASWSSAGIDAISALEIWKGSYHHDQVIINQGPWTKKWNAIGIGLYKNYAVVWFGREEDPEK